MGLRMRLAQSCNVPGARLRFAASVRIGLLTFEFPDARPGGVGAYVLKCAAALAAAGHEAHVFTLTVPAACRNLVPPGVQLHTAPDVAERVASGALAGELAAVALNAAQATYKLAVGALLCDAVRRVHREQALDLLEAAEYESLALPLLLNPVENLPVVVQIHLGSAANALGNDLACDELAAALELASIVGADAVCAATSSVVDVTRKLGPFQREVTIIPYPVAGGAEPAPPRRDGAVLYVGRLQRRKGCLVLAEAAEIFLTRRPNATLGIAGSDTHAGGQSMLAEMMARVHAGVRDRFVYLGELSQSELRREIAACRFQVVPSLVENFANTATDAMAMGRLVLYGGNTGLDEVVGDAGMRVWPLEAATLAAAMERAWDHPELAEEYGLRGFNRVRTQFDPAKVIRQRVEFYEKAIAERGRAERQWDALSRGQVKAVLEALVTQAATPLGIQGAIRSPGQLLLARLKQLADQLKRPPVVWLFGAGRFTTRLLAERHLWESAGLSLAGIVDEHPRFEQTPHYLGLPVQNPARLCAAIEGGQKVDAVILATDTLQAVLMQKAECFRRLGVRVLDL